MKTVKLNRRFRQFKEYGHIVALRFDFRNNKAVKIEKVCREKLKGHGWLPDHNWYCYWGNYRFGNPHPRPYWITFRNEADLTLVLLSVNLTKNA